MSKLVTNVIQVRGDSYTVSEMSGKVMQGVRKLLETEKWRIEPYLVFKCLVDPPLANESEAEALPQYVIAAVSTEVYRLTQGSEGDAKNV